MISITNSKNSNKYRQTKYFRPASVRAICKNEQKAGIGL